jgi:hypothetical protein
VHTELEAEKAPESLLKNGRDPFGIEDLLLSTHEQLQPTTKRSTRGPYLCRKSLFPQILKKKNAVMHK